MFHEDIARLIPKCVSKLLDSFTKLDRHTFINCYTGFVSMGRQDIVEQSVPCMPNFLKLVLNLQKFLGILIVFKSN